MKHGLENVDRETDGKRELRRRLSFQDVSGTLEETYGMDWADLLGRYGDPAKWLVLRIACRYTGMTLAELGEAAGGMDYAAVGMALRRLDRKLPDAPELRRLEARITHHASCIVHRAEELFMARERTLDDIAEQDRILQRLRLQPPSAAP